MATIPKSLTPQNTAPIPDQNRFNATTGNLVLHVVNYGTLMLKINQYN